MTGLSGADLSETSQLFASDPVGSIQVLVQPGWHGADAALTDNSDSDSELRGKDDLLESQLRELRVLVESRAR